MVNCDYEYALVKAGLQLIVFKLTPHNFVDDSQYT